MANKVESPLVKSVLALDHLLSELERIGEKITTMELKTDFDYEQARKLMSHFAESGQGVSEEVSNLSVRLNEARARAEAVAQKVSDRAELVNVRNSEEQEKLQEFVKLSAEVRDLSEGLAALRKPEGESLTAHDRERLNEFFAKLETQLTPLIDRAQALRTEARLSKMKSLEQNADSLVGTLQAIRAKIGSMNLFPGSASALN